MKGKRQNEGVAPPPKDKSRQPTSINFPRELHKQFKMAAEAVGLTMTEAYERFALSWINSGGKVDERGVPIINSDDAEIVILNKEPVHGDLNPVSVINYQNSSEELGTMPYGDLVQLPDLGDEEWVDKARAILRSRLEYIVIALKRNLMAFERGVENERLRLKNAAAERGAPPGEPVALERLNELTRLVGELAKRVNATEKADRERAGRTGE
jgi:hypothetical protein